MAGCTGTSTIDVETSETLTAACASKGRYQRVHSCNIDVAGGVYSCIVNFPTTGMTVLISWPTPPLPPATPVVATWTGVGKKSVVFTATQSGIYAITAYSDIPDVQYTIVVVSGEVTDARLASRDQPTALSTRLIAPPGSYGKAPAFNDAQRNIIKRRV